MKNTFGNNLTMTIFGESHGPYIGITLDGLPSGFPVDQKAILEDMKKRKAAGKISTQRHEDDIPQIVSGLLRQDNGNSFDNFNFQQRSTFQRL